MTHHAKIDAGGAFALPADVCRIFGLYPGDDIIVEGDGSGFRVRLDARELREAQAWAKQFVRPGLLASDELIAGRRTEAALEAAEIQNYAARE